MTNGSRFVPVPESGAILPDLVSEFVGGLGPQALEVWALPGAHLLTVTIEMDNGKESTTQEMDIGDWVLVRVANAEDVLGRPFADGGGIVPLTRQKA